ncbi:hypothetical protein Mame01_39910 [Microbispora amethystogenes]|nr:hypothetical protein Mame01_39910 [Microbispora amethystogenes]
MRAFGSRSTHDSPAARPIAPSTTAAAAMATTRRPSGARPRDQGGCHDSACPGGPGSAGTIADGPRTPIAIVRRIDRPPAATATAGPATVRASTREFHHTAGPVTPVRAATRAAT